MERGLFYLPCGNNVDDMPIPHLRDGITLSKDGMDGMHPYSMKKHLIRFVPTTKTQN